MDRRSGPRLTDVFRTSVGPKALTIFLSLLVDGQALAKGHNLAHENQKEGVPVNVTLGCSLSSLLVRREEHEVGEAPQGPPEPSGLRPTSSSSPSTVYGEEEASADTFWVGALRAPALAEVALSGTSSSWLHRCLQGTTMKKEVRPPPPLPSSFY